MINEKLAKTLLPLINSEAYDDLVEYVTFRISALQGQIESSNDINQIYRVQGAISELRLILRLRDTVNQMKG